MDVSILIVVGFVGLLLAIAGLFRPFLGLLIFLIIHFVQPGELIPALAPFRIELVYGTLLVLVLLRKASSSRFSLFSDRILFAALLLIGAGVLSVPFGVWPFGSAQVVFEVAKLTVFMLLITLIVDTEGRLRTLLWCLAAILTWFAASSLSGFVHGEFYALKYDWGTLERAQGINSVVGGPNELAGLLLALLPLLIALLRITRSIPARVLLLASGALSLVALSLTGSRIAIIALVAMAVYYAFQAKHKLLTCGACVVLGVLIWANLPPEYQQRYLTVESYAEGGQLDASNELRLEVWKAGWLIFSKYPIVGVGAGQFANAYGTIYLAGRSGDWMNPHNLFIQVICELGIVGLVVFGFFLWQIAKGIRVVLREQGNSAVALCYEVGAACSVMYVGIFIVSTVSHTLYRPYWYLLGGLVAANRGILLSKLKSLGSPADVQVPIYGRQGQPVQALNPSYVHYAAPQAALPLWRLGQERNAPESSSPPSDGNPPSRGSLPRLGPGETFPASYWTSNPERRT